MATKPKAEPHHASRVESLLHGHGAEHLRARCYGTAVIVESGPEDDPVKHFRLRRDTVHLWCLDMTGRGDRWERTDFRGNLDELVSTVVEDFPWVLTAIA
jgi:hypothetical protein